MTKADWQHPAFKANPIKFTETGRPYIEGGDDIFVKIRKFDMTGSGPIDEADRDLQEMQLTFVDSTNERCAAGRKIFDVRDTGNSSRPWDIKTLNDLLEAVCQTVYYTNKYKGCNQKDEEV